MLRHFALIVHARDTVAATEALVAAGERVTRIGRIVARAADAPGTIILGMEQAWPG